MGSIPNSSQQNDEEEEESSAFMLALSLCIASSIPMTLKAGIEIGVFDVLAKAGTTELTSSEIASHLPITNSEDGSVVLDRILRFLAAHSILTCSSSSAERRYGLAPAGRFLTRDKDGTSLAPFVLMNQDPVLLDSWQHLKDSVLEGVIPFNQAHGMSAFDYNGSNPRFNKVFNQCMAASSTMIVRKVIESYRGFEAIQGLVDVGGGSGEALRVITSKYPHIKGTNFDLHHVISNAPSIPGVENVMGDMFVSIPNGDNIFMKWILHDWSDSHCLKILKNCWKALPDSGKVIVVEQILREADHDSSITAAATRAAQFVLYSDLCMLTYNPGGKERTEKELELLGKEAGFSGFKVVCPALNNWVMEFSK